MNDFSTALAVAQDIKNLFDNYHHFLFLKHLSEYNLVKYISAMAVFWDNIVAGRIFENITNILQILAI